MANLTDQELLNSIRYLNKQLADLDNSAPFTLGCQVLACERSDYRREAAKRGLAL